MRTAMLLSILAVGVFQLITLLVSSFAPVFMAGMSL